MTALAGQSVCTAAVTTGKYGLLLQHHNRLIWNDDR